LARRDVTLQQEPEKAEWAVDFDDPNGTTNNTKLVLSLYLLVLVPRS
jgi:hypothetical protein